MMNASKPLPAEDLSLILPWSDRATLDFTLRRNVAALTAAGCGLIIVNCGGDISRLRTYIPPGLPKTRLINIRRSFNKSLAMNAGLALAETSYVSMMDADIVFTADYLAEAASALRPGGTYVTAAQMCESAPAPILKHPAGIASLHRQNYLHFRFHDGRAIRLRTYNSELMGGARAGVGLLSASRADLQAVGGYDSRLTVWGWEDLDVQLRLMYVLDLRRIELGTVEHISHGDSTRNLGSLTKEQANSLNMNHCINCYNRGEFQGTYLTDREVEYEVCSIS